MDNGMYMATAGIFSLLYFAIIVWLLKQLGLFVMFIMRTCIGEIKKLLEN